MQTHESLFDGNLVFFRDVPELDKSKQENTVHDRQIYKDEVEKVVVVLMIQYQLKRKLDGHEYENKVAKRVYSLTEFFCFGFYAIHLFFELHLEVDYSWLNQFRSSQMTFLEFIKFKANSCIFQHER